MPIAGFGGSLLLAGRRSRSWSWSGRRAPLRRAPRSPTACRSPARPRRPSCGRPRSSARRESSIGITHPDQYTLTDGTRTCRAAWKTIDEFKRGVTSLQGGGVIVDFTDSYKHEIAAYELDKLLGLDLVPPTVERTFGGTKGSLQLWVEGAMTEADRKQKKIAPPDPQAWNEQMYKVRLLHQLTDNTDFRNINNVLSRPVVPGLRGRLLARLHHLRGPARPEGAGPFLPFRARGPEGPRPAHPPGEARALARRPPDRQPAEAAGQDPGARGAPSRRSAGRPPSSTDRAAAAQRPPELGRDLSQVVLAERDGRHRRVRPSRARVAQPVGKGLLGPGAIARSRLRVERREEAGEVGPRVPGADGARGARGSGGSRRTPSRRRVALALFPRVKWTR